MTAFGPVIDMSTTAPPGSPSEGDAYVISAAATGDWSGLDYEYVIWRNDAWVYSGTPENGSTVWNNDDNVEYVYAGAWFARGTRAPDANYGGQTISNPPTQAEVQTLDDAVAAITTALRSSGLMASP